MRPPICAICRKDFRRAIKTGGKVRFKASEADQRHNEKLKKPGFVGHPAGVEWFCEKHLALAKTHRHLTWKEAYPIIKAAAPNS